MSDCPDSIVQAAPGKLGPGRLVLVVGPSGAGKDTLLDHARMACAKNPEIVFVRRVVTRAASAFEDNEAMTPQAFGKAVAQGAFAAHWGAHGNRYGLRRDLDDEIRAGRTAVANVSRAAIGDLRARYANTVVVLVTAPPEVLAERLAGRARSSDGPVDARLNRVVDEAALAPDITISNTGPVSEGAAVLLAAIRSD